MEFLSKLKDYGPLMFGVGFVAPLIAQSMDASSLSAPLGLSSIVFGLLIGVLLGAIAKRRGRWI